MPTFAPGRSRPEYGCHQALGLVVQVTVTTSKMSVPSVLYLFPRAGPVHTCCRTPPSPPCPPALGTQQGRMGLQRELGALPWLQALSSFYLCLFFFFFNHCSGRCTAKQLSKRCWDFRYLQQPVYPRMGNEEKGTPGGSSLLLS